MNRIPVYLLPALLLFALLPACNNGGAPPTTPASVTTVAPTIGVTPTTDATPAPTVPLGPPARLVDWVNQVDARPQSTGAWELPQTDMSIAQGGQVRAQEASTARVVLPNEVIRVAPNTTFTFAENTADTLRLRLDEGQLWINVEGLEPGKTFEVETPAAVASVRGTRFSVRVDRRGRTVVSVREGIVDVIGATRTITVSHGLESEVPPGGEPTPIRHISLPEQARWGMADGADLSIAWPAFGEARVYTTTGLASRVQLSPDGCYVSGFYRIPGSDPNEKGPSGPVYANLCTGETLTHTLPSGAEGITFSPVSDQLAFTERSEGKSQICTQRLDGSARACLGGDGYYGWPFWSPDGQWLAFYAVRPAASGLQLYRARPDGSDLQLLTSGREGNHHAHSWSPDGGWLAYIYDTNYDQPGELWLMQADGSAPRQLFDQAHGSYLTTWSRDGNYLAFVSFDQQIWLATPADDGAQVLAGFAGQQCREPAWSPTASGWPLFFTCFDPAQNLLQRWRLSAADAAPQVVENFVSGPLWSADGARAVFWGSRQVEEAYFTEFALLESDPALFP